MIRSFFTSKMISCSYFKQKGLGDPYFPRSTDLFLPINQVVKKITKITEMAEYKTNMHSLTKILEFR